MVKESQLLCQLLVHTLWQIDQCWRAGGIEGRGSQKLKSQRKSRRRRVSGEWLVKNEYILKNEKMSWNLKKWTEWLKKKKGLACLGSQGESLPWTPSHAQVWTWGSMRFLCWYLHTQTTWLGTEIYICSTCQSWSPKFLRSQILFLHWW